MDWINLAVITDQLCTAVKVKVNVTALQKAGNFIITCSSISFSEGFCSVYLVN